MLKALGGTALLGTAGCLESGSDDGGGGGGDGGDGGDGGGDGGDGGSGQKETVKAAYVYAEPLSDQGYYHRHDVARKALEEKYDWYETKYVEDVPASEAKDVFESLINDGYDIIEGTTFDYGPAAVEVGRSNPDVFLETFRVSRVENSPANVGQYVGNIAEARFLSGVAAGLLTETDTLGFVVAYPIPVLYGEINAMMLGAKSVNPDATMKIRTINTWFDPSKEQQAAKTLVDNDADVIADHQSSPAVTRTAASEGAWAIGYADTLASVAGDNYVTSCMWNHEPLYDATAQAARNGTLTDKSRFEFPDQRLNFYGLDKGGIKLDDFGPQVPQSVIDEVESTKQSYIDGEFGIWDDTKWADMNKYQRNTQMGEYVDGVQKN